MKIATLALATCLLATQVEAAPNPNFDVGYFNRNRKTNAAQTEQTATVDTQEQQSTVAAAPTPAPQPSPAPVEQPKNKDAELVNNIQDALQNAWMHKSYKTVRVQSNNGVVTLTGFVENEAQHKEVLDRVNKFFPRSIDDRITIHSMEASS